MFCGQCGKEIKEGNKFCTNCGAVIDSGSSINSELSLAIKKAKCVPDYPEGTFADEMDTVKFGKYPQSDVSGKKKEDIEWLVLEKQKNKALLISKYVLDQVPFYYPVVDENGHQVREEEVEENEAKWSKSLVRKYLNDEFINNAFTKNENFMICETQATSTIYKNFHWTSINWLELENKYKQFDFSEYKEKRDFICEETKDKVFLINYEEYIKYFGKANIQTIKMTKMIDNKEVPVINHLEMENSKGSAQFTKCIGKEDFDLPDLCIALRNNEYNPEKKYLKWVYKGYQIVKYDSEKDKKDGCCWYLNSLAWWRKLNKEHETYRRPIFVGTHGDVACANPGCVNGYGLRPAIWVKCNN